MEQWLYLHVYLQFDLLTFISANVTEHSDQVTQSKETPDDLKLMRNYYNNT